MNSLLPDVRASVQWLAILHKKVYFWFVIFKKFERRAKQRFQTTIALQNLYKKESNVLYLVNVVVYHLVPNNKFMIHGIMVVLMNLLINHS